MALLSKSERVMLPRARKRYGFSHSYGSAFFGYSFLGDDNEYSGIYQLHNVHGERKFIKAKFYWPTNPRTDTQQAWRGVFSDGAVAWAGLTSDEKLLYNNRAKRYRMTGYHLFQREWLSSH